MTWRLFFVADNTKKRDLITCDGSLWQKAREMAKSERNILLKTNVSN